MMRIITISLKLSIFFLLANLYLTYTAVSVEQINHTVGFGTLKWGTELDSLDNLKFVKSGKTSQGEIKIYKNTNDNLDYNGVELKDIEYGFNNDKLYFVAFKTNGPENWKELKEHALQKFGNEFNKIEDFGYQNYVWQRQESSVSLEYKPKQNSSVVLLIVSN
ncbi:MAG TPA: hypothetical protein VLB82_03780 [Thermodesulfobacteriota bacterium]|nr:hypothetical protein [Thermodesulfobacteriota bacterium]